MLRIEMQKDRKYLRPTCCPGEKKNKPLCIYHEENLCGFLLWADLKIVNFLHKCSYFSSPASIIDYFQSIAVLPKAGTHGQKDVS